MAKVIIEMSMSLDGFCAGPDDGEAFPKGRDGIKHVFGWLSRAKEEGGANKAEVDRMYAQSGAYIFGRRTYDITNGWGGSHPLKGVPLFILTHKPPAAETVPKGDSKFTFVTDGIESAVRQAQATAGDKDVVISGASPSQQALDAGVVDEIAIHLAPSLIGSGIRLFDNFKGPILLEKVSSTDGPMATHVRYRVCR
ncbi:dihydrofolate reductase family protein [Bosea robiniae]|uniref:Dihydrofolate reductase n=1 Tax=Bosea robiniae TaxID=1036780 RepID=A0ABY0P0X4_9HYPH|nr:dihydrofolate reductase family protein [Bosea robiniae]SDG61375.1 Dihydrofolate reductase [Bosea robiniae]